MDKTYNKKVSLYSVREQLHRGVERVPHLTPESIGLGVLLALIGGFLDAYTYVSRDGGFATSQTGNLVLLGVEVSKGNWAQGWRHIPPILAFVIGVVVAQSLKQPFITRKFPHPARSVLFLESLVLLFVGALPAAVPNTFVVITIAFVSSVQISSFRTLVKWPYNSAMVTGNLRTAAEAAYSAFVLRNRQGIQQFFDFSVVIVSFLVGALLGTLFTQHFGTKAIWFVSGILICALMVLNANPKTLLKKG